MPHSLCGNFSDILALYDGYIVGMVIALWFFISTTAFRYFIRVLNYEADTYSKIFKKTF